MEGGSNRVEPCKQFLDLISHEGGKFVRDRELFGISEERKLELRLGPPGDWLQKESKNTQKIGDKEESLLCLGYFSKPHQNTSPSAGAKRGFSDSETGGRDNQKLSPCVPFPSPWSSSAAASSSPSPFPSAFQKIQQQQQAFLHFQNLPVFGKESSQTNGTKVELQNHEKRASSPDPAPAKAAVVNKNIQTRNVTGPVVGWPPVRSFRKNIASSSSKPSTDSPNGVSKITNKLLEEHTRKGLFVKINMDGVPIGRKVDLKAYNSYEKLSIAVDELFRGLLAAQRDSIVARNENTAEKNKAITGLLDGSGEFTLVYEDNEGDRMLVGDIPWEMFVTTVKRLRVLKTSELSALSFTNKQVKLAAAACGAA